MREIWFRGKRIDNSEWIYGAYIQIENKHYICSVADVSFGDNGNRIRVGCWHKVLAKTLGQYTGLKDKNGTKIFEGDIVKGNFYAEICVVVWSDKRCGFYLQPISKLGRASYDPYYKLNSAKLEIIGNIFDNGELLNED